MQKNLTSYLLYILISVLVVVLYLGDFGGLNRLQWKLDDIMFSLRGDEAMVDDIVLVNIDEASLNKFGDWPWSYDLLADLIAACNTGSPRATLLDIDLTTRISEDTTQNTQILANQISWAENIVLPYDIALAEYAHNQMSKPEFLWSSSIQVDYNDDLLGDGSALFIRKPFLPSGLLCNYADGLGFTYVEYDDDRRIRWAPLVANYDGYFYPSAELLTAALYRGLKPTDILLKGDWSVVAGTNWIPTDESGRTHINFSGEAASFRQLSAFSLFTDNSSLKQLKDALVIIGITAPRGGEFFKTPIAGKMPRPVLSANIIENIIHENYITIMELPVMVNVFIFLAFGALCALLLPRIPILYRIIALSVFVILLANVGFILFTNQNMLIRPLYLGLQIILFMVASPMIEQARIKAVPEFKRGKKPPKSTGQDIPAFKQNIPVRELKEDPGAPEFQKTEAMQTPPTLSEPPGTLETATHEPSMTQPGVFSDATPRSISQDGDSPQDDLPGPEPKITTGTGNLSIGRNSSPPEAPPETETPPEPETPPISQSSSPSVGVSGEVEKISHLGRYQVSEILGKGAMGTVFKGVDPAIGRRVALKTIRLDFVSDETEMAELRDRLLREAQAAGNLSHPNIVTIYDAGSEGTLQYIAMEYLEGQTLEQLIKRQVQFSYKIIAKVITQICDALDYAHNQGIVHRDIKPANIMVLSNYTVKVMDFGIARIDTSSMTRTGIAMGTPNYIAPELLQGQNVDRRCDIFSLGVVIYELLTGRRPFKGENLTSLVYSIVNDDPPAPSTINDNMPLIFDHIVAKALAKNPVDRYQKAPDLKLALSDFISSFGGASKVGI